MSSSDIIIPFTVCVLAGFILAVVELFQTFGRWIGPYWRNRYVIALTILNIVTAAVVYAFLRYALSIENTIWLAIITGITFPTILRSRFTFYRPLGQDSLDTDGFSLTLDTWYRDLQNLCYEEVNAQIAADRAQTMERLRHCLTPTRMKELLSDHIASEVMTEQKSLHEAQLAEILALETVKDRERRLAVLIMEIMPPSRVKAILKECPS